MVCRGMLWYGMGWYIVWYSIICGRMVWYGMLLYSMVWCRMAWYVVVRRVVLWYCIVWYGKAWYDMVFYGMVWCDRLSYVMLWYKISFLRSLSSILQFGLFESFRLNLNHKMTVCLESLLKFLKL